MLLWDFGDTLADERWMLQIPEGCPDWPAAWREVMATHADRWNVGAVATTDVIRALAGCTGMAPDRLAAHARRCCEQITFHSGAWSLARERRLPQAIVTVNPDLFVDVVVPLHDLSSVFDVIVASCTEGTDDKTALCAVALERLGYDGPRSEALLIDNRRDLVQAWKDSGGAGYLFEGDDRFVHDALHLLGQPETTDIE